MRAISKVHPQAVGAKGGNQEMSRTKGGLNTKIHLAVDAHGLPVRIALTEGTRADPQEAVGLTPGLPPVRCWLTKPATPTPSSMRQPNKAWRS